MPENAPYYQHDYEGSDDRNDGDAAFRPMPTHLHLKAAMLGSLVTIPITNGRLNFGTWQGIYLGEHRDRSDGPDGGSRTLLLTAWGD